MIEPVNNPASQTPGRSPAPASSATPEATPATPPAARPRRGKFGRVVQWTFVILLLLVVGGGVLVWVNLNKIVEHTVESQATAQLNLKTELDGAALSIFGGQVNLNDLQIASP